MPRNEALIAGWIATLDGCEVYLSEAGDPSFFHLRLDCPRLGRDRVLARVVNGIITDGNGFLYREVYPCTRCIRGIVKVDGTEQAPRTGQGGA